MESLEQTFHETAILGVKIQPLKIIPTVGGPVLHLLRSDYALMPTFPQGFGEIYCSEVEYLAIKGWKKHLRQTQLFAVPVGTLKIVLYDGRTDSKSFGQILEITLGRPDNYSLLKIPPNIWYSFKAESTPIALLINCADLPHDPSESQTLPLTTEEIPYTWN